MLARYILDGTGRLARTERATQVADAVVDFLNAEPPLGRGRREVADTP